MYTGHTRAASNRADWIFDVEVRNEETNAFVDLTGASIDVGVSLTSQTVPTLTGSLADGHCVVTGNGTFRTHFTRAEMTMFQAGDLDVGITVTLADGITTQLFTGQVPIVHGVVAA